MVVDPIPTVDELAPWLKLAQDAAAIAEKLAADAYDIRQAISDVYTSIPVSVYLHPEKQGAGTFVEPGTSITDAALVESAVGKVASVQRLDLPELQDGSWVKVAYSPTLRWLGETLRFFPGYNEAGEMVSKPSPYRSMLASGLLGAGLGYGIGAAGEWMLPRTWKRGRLRNTLGMLGGAAGVIPGALWGVSNKMVGRPFNDPSALMTPPNAEPQFDLSDLKVAMAMKIATDELVSEQYKTACDQFGQGMLNACKEVLAAEGFNNQTVDQDHNPLDVNIDYMGRTLWETGATPHTAGVTLGTLAAAQQMPGGNQPGWVTPAQMGNLAAHMGAGWLSGALVGSVLGALTGLPQGAQDTLKRTGTYLGIVQSVVPRLFG